MTGSPDEKSPAGSAAKRRRLRRAEILAATRELFDASGLRDAQIDDIAKSVGINRAIIYRHFSGKEELFAMTLVGYLTELSEAMATVDDTSRSPIDRLRAIVVCFLDFGKRFPAFVDCAMDLLRRPGGELLGEVSEEVLRELGAGIARCLDALVAVFEAGIDTGDFHILDPNLLANVLYTQSLGGLSLARFELRITTGDDGFPRVTTVSYDEVTSYLVEAAVAMALGAGAEPPSR